MQDFIIVGILLVLLVVGVISTIQHFKGKSSCCGGGNTYISKKKLGNVVAKKIVTVEGMMCENCVARVTEAINRVEGMSAKVSLKKKEVVVSLDREINDAVIKEAIEKIGYEVKEIK